MKGSFHDLTLFSSFSSNLSKEDVLIDDEHCFYQISNFKFAMQQKPLNVKILGGEWEKFKFSFLLSTFYNFLRLPAGRKILEQFASLMLRKREFFNVSLLNLV